MSSNTEKIETFHDFRFGFEVILVDAPMKQVRGEWVPTINANELRMAVLGGITTKPGRLSGAEVRFVRQWMERTTTQFGELLGVSHAAVLKWEKKGQHPTGMNQATEFRLRVLTLQHLPPAVQDRIIATHQRTQSQVSELTRLLGLIEEVWSETSVHTPQRQPIRIPPELVAQQSLPALRRP